QVPLPYGCDVVEMPRDLRRLYQERGLGCLVDCGTVLEPPWRRGIRAITELREPDLLRALAPLEHQVAILAHPVEGEETGMRVEPPGQAALGGIGRAVRRIGKAAGMC